MVGNVDAGWRKFLQVSPVVCFYDFDVNMNSLVIFLYGWCCNILNMCICNWGCPCYSAYSVYIPGHLFDDSRMLK